MGRNPALTVLMILSGGILLLPGACAIVFMVMLGSTLGANDAWIVMLWVFCLAVALGGIMLIRRALRTPPPSK